MFSNKVSNLVIYASYLVISLALLIQKMIECRKLERYDDKRSHNEENAIKYRQDETKSSNNKEYTRNKQSNNFTYGDNHRMSIPQRTKAFDK